MHVALLSADCVPNPGGVASHVFNLARALEADGIDVTVLGGCQDPDDLASFTPPFPGFRVRHIGGRRKISSAAFALWARRRLREVMRTSLVDVAHIHTFLADALALIGLGGKVRRVATNHSSGFLEAQARGERRRVFPFFLAGYDAIIAPSRELQEKSLYLGVPEERISYIPNGVDVDRFFPGEAGPEAWERIAPLSRRHRIVLATRRLVRKNGIHHLLDSIPSVLKSVPEARFVVAGDGPERGALERSRTALGLDDTLRFLGTVPNDSLMDLYRAADVCVLPSLEEATSISGLEAMACGKPLVGTRVGGIPEIVLDGETGILVPPSDPAALAEGLIRLLSDRPLAAKMGARALELARGPFSWTAIARETISVYEKCLRSPPS